MSGGGFFTLLPSGVGNTAAHGGSSQGSGIWLAPTGSFKR